MRKRSRQDSLTSDIIGQSKYVLIRVSRYPYIRLPGSLIVSDSQALQTSIGDPVQGLYNFTPSAPLEQAAGLRQLYQFGLYSHCAYTDGVQGICSNSSVANKWEPYSSVLADMPSNYSGLTQNLLTGNQTFLNSHYLAEFSTAAYYLLLMGSICAALAMIM